MYRISPFDEGVPWFEVSLHKGGAGVQEARIKEIPNESDLSL
jgi:hypothetical protein